MQILDTVFNIIIFLLSLTLIVSLHELGHFLLAKKAGILIHEYSIGMGPAIYRKKKGETYYAVRVLPLGGYVAMSGEDRENQLLKKDQVVGLVLNENQVVTEILLDQSTKKPSVVGKVVSFDLFGRDMAPLFIELEVSGALTRYEVDRKARYLYGVKNELQITPAESSFETKTLWQRFLVLFCGPLMNFILALVLVFIVALVQGKPSNSNVVNNSSNPALLKGDVITKIGDIEVSNLTEVSNALSNINSHKVSMVVLRNGELQTIEVYLTVVMNNLGIVNYPVEGKRDELYVGGLGTKAKEAGLQFEDKILTINGQTVTTWEEVITIARTYNLKEVSLSVLRDGNVVPNIRYEVFSLETLETIGTDAIQIRVGFDVGYEFNFLYSLYYPFVHFGESISQMVGTIALLINPNSGIGIGELSGPIGIFSLVQNAASQGIFSLLLFIAFLSVNIGLMNLLPIPALDGGRILFLGYEAITKKKFPAKVEFWINQISFYALIALMIYVTFGDVGRLF
ncbi:RIP metalloprotease RseP [Acholeplasma hippikon]|uniref:Zinc metalloprotease SA1105 n=1 Tax=Acholeplasma hippikon TaxID=264636 RepID=A0A449BL96_9MOLU|nr:RIP metalloprotease RseP [Acholeplasma hippikon]VEU83220.1 Putative zinc metalloprotease SA1105 [Acholeplasma hippikon]